MSKYFLHTLIAGFRIFNCIQVLSQNKTERKVTIQLHEASVPQHLYHVTNPNPH
jgi:hypothetical protein